MKKTALFLLLLFVIFAAVFAQEGAERGEFWICPVAETAFYSPSGLAYGGGLAIGYSRGATIGIKMEYFANNDGLKTMELNFLFRLYFFRARYSGPFFQIAGGPVIFAPFYNSAAIPAEFGKISAGLSFGWRFLFGKRFFVEPSIRAGYPYMAGAVVSAGIRF